MTVFITGCDSRMRRTALRALSEIRPAPVTLLPAGAAPCDGAAVVIEYGEYSGAAGVVGVYALPPDLPPACMDRIPVARILGVVILVDDRRDDAIVDIGRCLEGLRGPVRATTAAIGIAHVDAAQEGMRRYHDYMGEAGLAYPVFAVDAQCREDLSVLVTAMAAMGTG
jgi:hypothetical protein